MALPQGAISKLIEIINNRDKQGPSKPISAYQGGRTPTPTGMSNEFSYQGGLDSYMKEAARRGLDVSNLQSAEDLQGRIYDSLMASKEGQGIIRNMWKQYGDTIKGSGKILPENLSEQDLARLRSSFVDNKLGARTQMILGAMIPPPPPPPPSPPKQQREYTGEPVYLPGVQGALRQGTIQNALVGFLSDNAEFTPIEQADYDRFAVPKWAQESVAAGGADEYLRAKLGGYYKGTKKSDTKK